MTLPQARDGAISSLSAEERQPIDGPITSALSASSAAPAEVPCASSSSAAAAPISLRAAGLSALPAATATAASGEADAAASTYFRLQLRCQRGVDSCHCPNPGRLNWSSFDTAEASRRERGFCFVHARTCGQYSILYGSEQLDPPASNGSLSRELGGEGTSPIRPDSFPPSRLRQLRVVELRRRKKPGRRRRRKIAGKS